MKAKKAGRRKAVAPKPAAPATEAPNPHHKRDFDQLIDDAIFGVKKKK